MIFRSDNVVHLTQGHFYCVYKKLLRHLKVSLWIPLLNRRRKSIQDIRNEVDYDRLFFPMKNTPSCLTKQGATANIYIDSLTGITTPFSRRRLYSQAMVVIDDT